ncbi:MAG TPA: hypothetical protein VN957_11885 [Chthoniobacterales bacterium]|nr:hypothetical protein [Chthoniobacterales bacterium]
MKSYSLYQPPPRFRWPDDSKCCVMLCFDVDGETTALSEDPTLKNRLTTYSQTTYGPSIGVPRYRAPWFELNPWTPDLLQKYQIQYCASMMGDDVPYTHPNGLIEIPGQWMLEDWEQFAFNADPRWGFIPENCEKVFDLWWQEFAAMYDYGCCFVLTLHPWLSGRPSRVRLLERLVRSIQQKERTWFAAGQQIATYFRKNPDARHEIDFDRKEVVGNNVRFSLIP